MNVIYLQPRKPQSTINHGGHSERTIATRHEGSPKEDDSVASPLRSAPAATLDLEITLVRHGSGGIQGEHLGFTCFLWTLAHTDDPDDDPDPGAPAQGACAAHPQPPLALTGKADIKPHRNDQQQASGRPFSPYRAPPSAPRLSRSITEHRTSVIEALRRAGSR